MRCTNCGTESKAGKKFCAECGNPLSNRCSKCGSDNASGAKFCTDCGTSLSLRRARPRLASKLASASVTRHGARRSIRARNRRRAQDGHRAVRRYQGIDGTRAGSRSRGSARDHRSRAQADDRRGAPLRRLHRAEHRRRHLRAVRRAGRARGPSAARTLRRYPHAGRNSPLCASASRRRPCADSDSRRCEHRRSRRALDYYRRRSRRVHANRPHHQSRLADADPRRPRRDRNLGKHAPDGRGLLHSQAAGAGADQRRHRPGQSLRSDRTRSAAHAPAALGWTRVHEVRRTRSRDGCDAPCGRTREVGTRADRRRDGRGRRRQVAPVVRIQSDHRGRLDGARGLLGLPWQIVVLSAVDRPPAQLFQDCVE